VAASKHAEQYDLVPKALWGKFPSTWVLLLEKSMRVAMWVTMLILAFLVHLGAFFQPHLGRESWVVFISAAFCPVSFAAWYSVRPFNPYRTELALREGMKDLDQRDQDARHFVLLLNSRGAHRHLLKLACTLSLLLLVPMVIISVATQRTPVWRFGFEFFVGIPCFVFICLFLLFRMEILAWALKNFELNPHHRSDELPVG